MNLRQKEQGKILQHQKILQKSIPTIPTAIALEDALETLDRFIGRHEQKASEHPTLEPFCLENNLLAVKPLSQIEKTLSCFMEAVSKEKRLKKKQLRKPIQTALLGSVDAVQIALFKSHFEGGTHAIDPRLKAIADRYNKLVERANGTPRTLKERIIYFFYKAAGWLIEDELLHSHIQLPEENTQRKFSSSHTSLTSQKIASFIDATHPFTQEIDLFWVKAHTLLKHENLPHSVLDDALKSLRKTPIEATLNADALVQLRLPLSLLPGEEMIVTGNFSRKQAISVPIKESFKIIAKATQTGFPHPLQHTGMALSNAFLPSLLLRPYLAPKLDLLLKKKLEISHKLMPKGVLNERAKTLLQLRKKVFQEHKARLLPLQKKCMTALFETAKVPTDTIEEYFSSLELKDNFFVEMSLFHDTVLSQAIEKPVHEAKEAWLAGHIKERTQCEEAIEKSAKLHSFTGYGAALHTVLTKAAVPIGCLILSEKIGFKPELLDTFSKKMVCCTLMELHDFHEELEHLPLSETALLEWIISLLEKKTALFRDPYITDSLTDKFEAYFILRSL